MTYSAYEITLEYYFWLSFLKLPVTLVDAVPFGADYCYDQNLVIFHHRRSTEI